MSGLGRPSSSGHTHNGEVSYPHTYPPCYLSIHPSSLTGELICDPLRIITSRSWKGTSSVSSCGTYLALSSLYDGLFIFNLKLKAFEPILWSPIRKLRPTPPSTDPHPAEPARPYNNLAWHPTKPLLAVGRPNHVDIYGLLPSPPTRFRGLSFHHITNRTSPVFSWVDGSDLTHLPSYPQWDAQEKQQERIRDVAEGRVGPIPVPPVMFWVPLKLKKRGSQSLKKALYQSASASTFLEPTKAHSQVRYTPLQPSLPPFTPTGKPEASSSPPPPPPRPSWQCRLSVPVPFQLAYACHTPTQLSWREDGTKLIMTVDELSLCVMDLTPSRAAIDRYREDILAYAIACDEISQIDPSDPFRSTFLHSRPSYNSIHTTNTAQHITTSSLQPGLIPPGTDLRAFVNLPLPLRPVSYTSRWSHSDCAIPLHHQNQVFRYLYPASFTNSIYECETNDYQRNLLPAGEACGLHSLQGSLISNFSFAVTANSTRRSNLHSPSGLQTTCPLDPKKRDALLVYIGDNFRDENRAKLVALLRRTYYAALLADKTSSTMNSTAIRYRIGRHDRIRQLSFYDTLRSIPSSHQNLGPLSQPLRSGREKTWAAETLRQLCTYLTDEGDLVFIYTPSERVKGTSDANHEAKNNILDSTSTPSSMVKATSDDDNNQAEGKGGDTKNKSNEAGNHGQGKQQLPRARQPGLFARLTANLIGTSVDAVGLNRAAVFSDAEDGAIKVKGGRMGVRGVTLGSNVDDSKALTGGSRRRQGRRRMKTLGLVDVRKEIIEARLRNEGLRNKDEETDDRPIDESKVELLEEYCGDPFYPEGYGESEAESGSGEEGSGSDDEKGSTAESESKDPEVKIAERQGWTDDTDFSMYRPAFDLGVNRFRVWSSGLGVYKHVINRVTNECTPLVADALRILGDPNDVTGTAVDSSLGESGLIADCQGVVIVQCCEIYKSEAVRRVTGDVFANERRRYYSWASGPSLVEAPLLLQTERSEPSGGDSQSVVDKSKQSKHLIDFSATELLTGSTSINLRWCPGCRACLAESLAKTQSHNSLSASISIPTDYDTCNEECIRQRRTVAFITTSHLERVDLSLPKTRRVVGGMSSSEVKDTLSLKPSDDAIISPSTLNHPSLFPPLDVYHPHHPDVTNIRANYRLYCNQEHRIAQLTHERNFRFLRRHELYRDVSLPTRTNIDDHSLSKALDVPRPLVLRSTEQQEFFDNMRRLYITPSSPPLATTSEPSTLGSLRSTLSNLVQSRPSLWYDPWWYHLRFADFEWAKSTRDYASMEPPLLDDNTTVTKCSDSVVVSSGKGLGEEKGNYVDSILPCAGMVCYPRMDYPNRMKARKSFLSPGGGALAILNDAEEHSPILSLVSTRAVDVPLKSITLPFRHLHTMFPGAKDCDRHRSVSLVWHPTGLSLVVFSCRAELPLVMVNTKQWTVSQSISLGKVGEPKMIYSYENHFITCHALRYIVDSVTWDRRGTKLFVSLRPVVEEHYVMSIPSHLEGLGSRYTHQHYRIDDALGDSDTEVDDDNVCPDPSAGSGQEDQDTQGGAEEKTMNVTVHPQREPLLLTKLSDISLENCSLMASPNYVTRYLWSSAQSAIYAFDVVDSSVAKPSPSSLSSTSTSTDKGDGCIII